MPMNPFGKLLSLLTTGERMRMLLILVLQIVVALFEVAGIASIMPFVAVVANPELVETNQYLRWITALLGLGSRNSFLLVLGFVVLAFVVLGNLAKALALWVTLRFENQLNYSLARRLLNQYMMRPYAFFLNRNSAELGKNVLAEVRTVVGGVLANALSIVACALVSITIICLLLIVDPIVAIIIAASLCTVYGIVFGFSRKMLSRIGREQVHANAQKFKAATEALSGIKDVKVMGRAPFFLNKFSKYAGLQATHNVSAGVLANLPRYALEIIAFGGIVVILISFLARGESTQSVIALAAMYAFAGYRLLPAFQQIYSCATNLKFNLPALDILHQDLAPESAESGSETGGDATRLVLRYRLRLENIWFTYPNAPAPSLQGVTLEIPVNSTVAFVGSTGSGKTTIIDIILRLLLQTKGSVLADGVEINGALVRSWQRNLGYVPQQLYLTDDTMRRNIAFGLADEEIDDDAVVRAARIASLHDFIIDELPQGYETVVGDRGVRLSGGQRQRVGIARALYCDPDVLILDEATSALDRITEQAIVNAIRQVAGRKTIIMVAHRLSTVQHADTIFLLDKGMLVDSGTYAHLTESSKWFETAAQK